MSQVFFEATHNIRHDDFCNRLATIGEEAGRPDKEHNETNDPMPHGTGRSPRPEGATRSTTYFRWAWPTACGLACGWTRRVRAMPLAGAAARYSAVASAP